MGQTLRDWYRYLEKQMHVRLREEQPAPLGPGGRPADSKGTLDASRSVSSSRVQELRIAADASREPSKSIAQAAALRQRMGAVVQQSALPMELGPVQRRRGGRRPITETREEIIRRLLDPELTLHEAAAVLNLSKATVRRYTDHGKLVCLRTSGGQRRFHLSTLLTFLDRQAAERGEV